MDVREILPGHISAKLDRRIADKICEIRMRCGSPLALQIDGENRYCHADGSVGMFAQNGYTVTKEDCVEVLNRATKYSMYSHQNSIAEGYLTIEGGIRIGIGGEFVCREGTGEIRTVRTVSSLCVRVPHQILHAADEVRRYVADKTPYSTLLVSPPGMGKTTMLRELARVFSEQGYRVGIADERGEISACYQGVSPFHLGPNTDVVTGTDKARMLSMMLRAMNPQILVTDEIGSREDATVLLKTAVSGVRVIATVHGDSYESLHRNKNLEEVLPVFERIVLLKTDVVGEIDTITDGKGNVIERLA